jgi:hypothetical protein
MYMYEVNRTVVEHVYCTDMKPVVKPAVQFYADPGRKYRISGGHNPMHTKRWFIMLGLECHLIINIYMPALKI